MPTIVEVPKGVASPALTPPLNPVQLLSGLGGVIGSDFRSAQNQLVFVEYDAGKVSALNLFSSSTVVSSGTTTLKGTFIFDLDTGVRGWPRRKCGYLVEPANGRIPSDDAQNNAAILNLGVADFAAITTNNLEFLSYTMMPIDGNNDPQ